VTFAGSGFFVLEKNKLVNSVREEALFSRGGVKSWLDERQKGFTVCVFTRAVNFFLLGKAK
jgi:hypothetical protein